MGRFSELSAKEVKPKKDTRRAVKEAEECFGKTKTWGADTYGTSLGEAAHFLQLHGCHGWTCKSHWGKHPVSWHTLGRGEGVWKAHPRPYEALNKQRSAVTVVSAQLRAWIQPIRSHPVDVISHNQSGNCAEKGFKQKSVDKMLSMYYFEVSIGFKMALRVDIAQWCHPQWLGSSPYDAKDSKNCRPFIVGCVGGPVWITFGNPLFHWVDPMYTGNARINLLTVRVTLMGVHLFTTSRSGRVWLPY